MSEILNPGLRLANNLSLFNELLKTIRTNQTAAQAHDFAMQPGFRDEPGIGQDFHALGEDRYKLFSHDVVQTAPVEPNAHGIALVGRAENPHPRVKHHDPAHSHLRSWPRSISELSQLRRPAV